MTYNMAFLPSSFRKSYKGLIQGEWIKGKTLQALLRDNFNSLFSASRIRVLLW